MELAPHSSDWFYLPGLAYQTDDQLPEILPRDRVHTRRRLVQQQHLRPVDQGSRQPQFLLHPTRQETRSPVDELAQSHKAQDFHAARLPFGCRQPAHFGKETDIFQNGQLFVKGKALRKITDIGACLLGLPQDIKSGDTDQRG